MTAPDAGPMRALACRDLGFSCEWSIRSQVSEEIGRRFREHAKCAHGLDPIPPDLAARLEGTVVARP